MKKTFFIFFLLTSTLFANIFSVCASCHGFNGNEKALSKSQIIKGWSKERITFALQGYKNGSYGGEMKGIMKGQVRRLSQEDIKELSLLISSF